MEEQNFIFVKIVEPAVGSLEEIPSVEGERRSIFYSLRVHEVLMRPESLPQWDQRS